MHDIRIDLNKVTKDYTNKSGEFALVKNAIKSSIIDAKLEYGSNCNISFEYRRSDNKPFDLFVNETADGLIKGWNE